MELVNLYKTNERHIYRDTVNKTPFCSKFVSRKRVNITLVKILYTKHLEC